MDALTNPYTPGAGAPPPALAGRQDELEAFRLIVGRLSAGLHENSLILYGLRGVGKTVLLGEMAAIAEAEGWRTISIEARAHMDFTQALARAVFQAVRKLQTPTGTARAAVNRVWRALASLEVTYSDRGWALALKAEPEEGVADSGDLEEDLAEMLVLASEAAQEAGAGLALFVDEMQLMPRADLEALVAAFHRASQRRLPIALAGAGLPQLPTIIAEAKTYAERLFSYRRIDSLTAAAAREALERPAAEAANASFESAALETILDRSGRYPYFLQVYGKRVWDAAPSSPITGADVTVIIPTVQDELDAGFFYVRWEKATPKERDYMRAMADLGDGPQGTAAVATRMDKARPSDVSPQRDSLIKKGLIYAPDYGLVEFTAPLFGDYIRRAYPLP